MSKFFAVMFSVLLVVAAAVPAVATDSRLISLGSTYVGNFIEDDYNIFTWYATLPSYSNTLWLGLSYYGYYESGVSLQADGLEYAGTYLGASYGLGSEGKYGTLAMFYYNYAQPLLYGYEGFWPGAGVFNGSVNNKWTVLYGYPMEKLSFGLYFNRSDYDQKYEDETDVYRQNYLAYTTIGAGLRFDLGEKAYMDVAFDYNMATQKTLYDYNEGYYYGYGEVTEDANAMMGFRGRLFYELNETVTLVPYFSYRTWDFSLKADSADWKDSHFGNKGTELDVAIAANLKVNEDNLLIFGIEPYYFAKYEPSDPPDDTSYEVDDTYMPVFYLALESDVRDWLTFRVGGAKGFT